MIKECKFSIFSLLIIFLTVSSTILPLFVLGISDICKIRWGTCLGESNFFKFCLIKFWKLSVNLKSFCNFINNIILVSLLTNNSAAMHSSIFSIFSITLYSSAVPILIPPEFKVASDRPYIIYPPFSVDAA